MMRIEMNNSEGLTLINNQSILAKQNSNSNNHGSPLTSSLSNYKLGYRNHSPDRPHIGSSNSKPDIFSKLMNTFLVDVNKKLNIGPLLTKDALALKCAGDMVDFSEIISNKNSKYKDLVFVGDRESVAVFNIFKQFSTLENKNIYFFSFDDEELIQNQLFNLQPNNTFISISSPTLVKPKTMRTFRIASKWMTIGDGHFNLKTENISFLTKNVKEAKSLGIPNTFNPWQWHTKDSDLPSTSLALLSCIGKDAYLKALSSVNSVALNSTSLVKPLSFFSSLSCTPIFQQFFIGLPLNTTDVIDKSLTPSLDYIATLDILNDEYRDINSSAYQSPFQELLTKNFETLLTNRLIQLKYNGVVQTDINILAIEGRLSLLHLTKELLGEFALYLTSIYPMIFQKSNTKSKKSPTYNPNLNRKGTINV